MDFLRLGQNIRYFIVDLGHVEGTVKYLLNEQKKCIKNKQTINIMTGNRCNMYKT